MSRILFGASFSAIEPLGLLHLGGLARDLGWERDYILIKDHDFEPFYDKIREFKPDLIGFNVYTGNHTQLHTALAKLRIDHPNVKVILGGPHATYFPVESLEIADFVVMSEGFKGLKKILSGAAAPGIVPPLGIEHFPMPDRDVFYEYSPYHANSKIKSVITMTGCPYTCTYCYNSSSPSDLENVTPELAAQMVASLGKSGRLFPKNVRPVNDVVQEGKEIADNWPTKLIYFQDDVHGFDVKGWMTEFKHGWKAEVGLPYHAQMRWEMTAGDSGSERLDLLTDAGCFGLTLAIEAADPFIRDEVLNRKMTDGVVFEGMTKAIDRGLKIRTEQITALPYGATTKETPINLDADLGLVELNVRLRSETGGPTMAWASTLAPYKGTKLGAYCEKNGHYRGDNNDVKDTFFERSVLRFPSRWVGPDLSKTDAWLPHDDLDWYRDQNAELRRHFNFFCLVPDGHKLARRYIERGVYTHASLDHMTEAHLEAMRGSSSTVDRVLSDIKYVRTYVSARKDLQDMVVYLSCLPLSTLAVGKIVDYADKKGGLTPDVLSTAVRHHLYDNVLYATKDQPIWQTPQHSLTPS